MKKLLILALVFVSAAYTRADVTINLGGGNLYFADGTTLAPVGSLVQLIVSRGDSVFTAPSDGSFIGGSSDDFVIRSFTINQGPGAFAEQIIFSLTDPLGPGDQLLLRWFPALTLADSAPTAGTQYGQFRTDLVENFSTTGWIVPSDSATIALNFLTGGQGGSRSEAEGAANLVVMIPEPSTYALFLGGLGLVGFVRRRTKARTE